MNIKKVFCKIGIVPIIIMLTVGLFGAVPVMAQVEPEVANVTATLDPGLGAAIPNDGTGVQDIDLAMTWDTDAQYYILEVKDPDGTLMYSSGQIDMTSAVSPWSDTTTHSYTVLDGGKVGNWTCEVGLYTGTNPTVREGWSGNTFRVAQTVDVIKFNDLDGDGVWEPGSPDFEPEIVDLWTANIATTGWSDSALMPESWALEINGDYDVTEDLLDPDWHETTTSPQQFTIPSTDDIVIYIGNQEEPQTGSLLIHKYNDINGNGDDDGEPDLEDWEFDVYGPDNPTTEYTPGMNQLTDVNGEILLTGVPVGQYKVVENLLAGDPLWRCTDPGSSLYEMVTVYDEQQAEVDFGNQQLGDLLIFKYEDTSGAVGDYDGSDLGDEGWNFNYSGPSNGSVGPTDSNGYILVEDLIPGTTYYVVETSGPPAGGGYTWICTEPGAGKTQGPITVPTGGTSSEVHFGNKLQEYRVPTLGQWGIIIMSTAFVALLIWFGVRRRQTA